MRDKQRDRIIFVSFVFRNILAGNIINDFRAAGLAVLSGNFFQLPHHDFFDLTVTSDGLFQIGNILFQFFNFFQFVEKIFLVEVTQLDFGDEFRLWLIHAEPDHQVRNDGTVLFGFPDDADCFVDIQNDFLKSL